MASSKDRERKLARAKLDRQMARRAEKARIQRQRQSQIGIGLAVLLVLAGVGAFTHWYGLTSPAKPTVVNANCSWQAADTEGNTSLKATGNPPPVVPTSGTATMTMDTNEGTITAQVDVTNAPCIAESYTYLASTKFFDGTTCTRLGVANPYVLGCGDPAGNDQGGPSYTIPDENLPINYTPAGASAPPTDSTSPPSEVIYPAGTIVLDTSAGPNTGGSRFLIVYKDTTLPPTYPVFAQITNGLDVVQKIAKAGAGKATSAGVTPPKKTVTINTLTVSPVVPASPSGAPSTAPTPSAPASSS